MTIKTQKKVFFLSTFYYKNFNFLHLLQQSFFIA